ncbi:MAG: RNA polymerase sigma factor [Verrucomicrobiales bacterium]|nr:RNA polymerase sigma factor [Verrucomicrobiales bacterium]
MQPAVIATLVEEHYQNLYRFALSLTRNEMEAADLTQQTYLKLAKKGGQIQDITKAKSWLFTTLRREFYALRKQTDRYTSLEDEEQLETEAPDNVEFEILKKANSAMVMEALNQIPEVYRVPLALFYFEDFSYQEIARILDVKEGTVMSRLYRGKSELRNWLVNNVDSDALPTNIALLQQTPGK